jgi:hypothetical protein
MSNTSTSVGDANLCIKTAAQFLRTSGEFFSKLPDGQGATRLPAAKITEVKQFTPTVWAEAKAKDKFFAQAA